MSAIFKTTSHLAIVALLATAPAIGYAQTDDSAAEEPATDDAATDEAAAEEAPAEEPAKPVEGQIVMQSGNTMLAGDLMGSAVFSEAGEEIGDISDMIVNLDGQVEGIVIGVGGFLGIGEKRVAIEMGSLSTTTDEEGNARLVTSATRADLEAADEFVTAEEQMAAQEAADAAAEQGTDASAEGEAGGDGEAEMAEDPAATETVEPAEPEMEEGDDAMAEEGAEDPAAETAEEEPAEDATESQ